MSTSKWQRSFATLAVAILTLAAGAIVLAEESEEETSLTGELSWDADNGRYILTESESGDEIWLRGAETLAEHVGEPVKVTGEWAEDSEGNEYFAVSTVEPTA